MNAQSYGITASKSTQSILNNKVPHVFRMDGGYRALASGCCRWSDCLAPRQIDPTPGVVNNHRVWRVMDPGLAWCSGKPP